MKLHFLFDATFRSNPLYALTEWGSLNQSEQETLAGLLIDNPEVFGIFKPTTSDGTLSLKLAYKDVALLFYFLQQPGKLPKYIKHIYDDEMNTVLAKLVMEEVLQIESDGNFFSGVNAFKILYKDVNKSQFAASNSIATLSKKAIEYVLQLNYLDYNAALARLYGYNTIPVIFEKQALNTPEEVEHFLGIGNNSSLEKELLQQWDKHVSAEKYQWLSFSRRQNVYRRNKNVSTYKMYISPLLSDLPALFGKTTEVLPFTKAFAFKLGINQRGLLRPDKFVIYFYQYKDLEEAAMLLKDKLSEHPAQGVPFTAQLDETGLLSWGVDPPKNDVLDGFEGGSWRARITEKLAAAVLQAKAAQLSKNDAYQYVINKIYLEKIDPYTWIPQENMWN